MNADFLAVLEFWEREKGISRDVLIAAVEESMLSAAKKAVGPARELRCAIDPKSGDIKAFAKLVVSEKVVSKHDQISVFDARRVKADAQLGDELEVEVTPAGFGRIASQYAKQALMQHIRRAEKQLIFTEFKDRVGDIMSGVVRRFERSDVTITWENTRLCCPTGNVSQPRNIKSANASAAMSKPWKAAPTARRSFFRGPTRS